MVGTCWLQALKTAIEDGGAEVWSRRRFRAVNIRLASLATALNHFGAVTIQALAKVFPPLRKASSLHSYESFLLALYCKLGEKHRQGMSASSHVAARLRPATLRSSTASLHPHGRCPPYRRVHQFSRYDGPHTSFQSLVQSRSPFYAIPPTILPRIASIQPPPTLRSNPSRSFFSRPSRPEEVKDRPREGARDQASQEASAGETGRDEDKSESSSREEAGEEQSGPKEEQKKKEQPAPPPPHGNKTPWQVFTETLQKEFKASKEWNESTKALASSANQFSENESVKRARAAYSAASDAAGSRASTVLKTTGRAIGSSAAWTWETPVVKGVRTGANAVGRGLDTATKPVRETKAYKNLKDVIDDGSSSKYGGWVEKEERRKKRELEESKDGKQRVVKLEEDPKYVFFVLEA